MRKVLPLVLAAMLLATSCSSGSGDKSVPDSTITPATTAVIEVTTAPPPTEAPETTIKGTPRTVTTQTTTLGPGNARIVGTVNGPEGPVTGAVIKVERFVGSAVATADLRSQGGTWSLDSILGGSYRVTVYRPPDLAQGAAEVFFLAADETKTLTTNLVRYGDGSVTASIDPNPPVIGQPTVLTVRFGTGGVGADGSVVVTPRPGIRVQLNVGPGLFLETLPNVVSDGAGAASWQLRCLSTGVFPATILVDNASSALVLPACVAPAPAAAAPPTTAP